MSHFMIQRTTMALPDDKAMAGASAFLFKALDGLSEEDRKVWRRFWKRVISMQAGELIDVEMKLSRNPKFHRKFFALLNLGFEAWEPDARFKAYKGDPILKNFDRFREDVTILAGFYEQTFTLDGSMTLRAKSISFANMDDAEFEKVYSAVADVLLQKVLRNYADREELDKVVEQILGFV